MYSITTCICSQEILNLLSYNIIEVKYFGFMKAIDPSSHVGDLLTMSNIVKTYRNEKLFTSHCSVDMT